MTGSSERRIGIIPRVRIISGALRGRGMFLHGLLEIFARSDVELLPIRLGFGLVYIYMYSGYKYFLEVEEAEWKRVDVNDAERRTSVHLFSFI